VLWRLAKPAGRWSWFANNSTHQRQRQFETRGFLKLLVDKRSDRILGFTAFAPEAGEFLPVVQLAMASQLPYTVIGNIVLTHPTMGEGPAGLFGSVRTKT